MSLDESSATRMNVLFLLLLFQLVSIGLLELSDLIDATQGKGYNDEKDNTVPYGLDRAGLSSGSWSLIVLEFRNRGSQTSLNTASQVEMSTT